MASGEDKSGTTAVCALISPTHIFVANCGDSRAVLYRGGKIGFSTQDHKPVNPVEKERIQNAGGSVMIQRVNGSLAVSRALGDYEYKVSELHSCDLCLVCREEGIAYIRSAVIFLIYLVETVISDYFLDVSFCMVTLGSLWRLVSWIFKKV